MTVHSSRIIPLPYYELRPQTPRISRIVNLPSIPTTPRITTPQPSSRSTDLSPPSPTTPERPVILELGDGPWRDRINERYEQQRRRSPTARTAPLPRSSSPDEPDSLTLELERYITESRRGSNMSTSSLRRKVVIMGAPSVGGFSPHTISRRRQGHRAADVAGKTSLTQQYIAPPTYTDSYYPTIEATSHKTVKFEGIEYECEIVDSAGQVSSLVRRGGSSSHRRTNTPSFLPSTLSACMDISLSTPSTPGKASR